MYGPRFTYDPCTNIIYADREAVDASRALADGVVFQVLQNITRRPNPHGFPMNIREVQETVNYIHLRQASWQATLRLISEFHRISESVIMRYRDLAMHEIVDLFECDNRLPELQWGMPRPYFIPLDPRYRRTGNGSVANGAGLTAPVNGSLDDWCQYTAHHFWPGGLNPTGGTIMDTSFRVSFSSVWGMVLLRFLHPVNAKNYYARYLAGIIFRPRYYTEFIWRWNRDCMGELPISIAAGSPIFHRMVYHGAGENLSKLDVIRHLAVCAITQEMLNSAYPWALAWIDQHSGVHFREANRQLEIEWQIRLQQHGAPPIAPALQGWWSPDIGDTHRIRALLYYERYEYQPTGRVHVQENPFWLLRGEDAAFAWLNEFPPSLPIPNAVMSPEPDDDIDVPMTPDDASNLNDTITEPAPNGAADEATMENTQESEYAPEATMPDIATELDKTHLATGYNTL